MANFTYPTTKIFGYTTFTDYQEPLPPLVPDDFGLKKSYDKRKILLVVGIVGMLSLAGALICIYENSLNIGLSSNCHYLVTPTKRNNMTLFYYVINDNIYCPDYCFDNSTNFLEIHSHYSTEKMSCPLDNSTCAVTPGIIYYCNKRALHEVSRMYFVIGLLFVILFVSSLISGTWIMCKYLTKLRDDDVVNVHM